MQITIGIKPGAAATADQIQAFGEGVLPAMGKGLARGLLLASGVAQTRYLSGPRPTRLGVRTGRLRGSIVTKVQVGANAVRGAIGTNVPYGAYHEYGFHGTQTVSPHRRTVGVYLKQRKANGAGILVAPPTSLMGVGSGAPGVLRKIDLHEHRRPVYDDKGRLVRYRYSVRDAAAKVAASMPRTHLQVVSVKEHTRTVNYAGRPFIRPALKDTEPQMLQALREEVGKLLPV